MAKKKKQQQTAKQISNRRARHDYALDDSILVGIALTGAETKSLRMGHGSLRGAYVVVKDNELWLVNASIMGSSGIPITDTEVTRNRKLLAKRAQITALIEAKQQGQAIIPLELLTRGRFIKLRIASGRGKKLHDKRHDIKRRDQERDAQIRLSR